jgi:hypothetical protein
MAFHKNLRIDEDPMKRIIILLSLILAGCSSIYLDTSDLLRDQNKENLKKLSAG